MDYTPDGPVNAPGSRRAAVLARLDDAAVTTAARTGVSPRAVVGVLVVALVVVGVLSARVLLARSTAQPVPLAPATTPTVRLVTGSSAAPGGPGMSAPTAGSTLATTPAAATTPAVVLVHVVGQVRRPGVVRLRPGARVLDALAAAGGVTRGADLTAVNLARPVIDGEQVMVPRPGQSTAPAPGPAPAGSTGAPSSGTAARPIDLNAATEADLDALPGIGPVLAGRIVQFRQQHSRFTSVDELGEVSGIGNALLERLRPLVRV